MESIQCYKECCVNITTDKEYRWWDTGVEKFVPCIISYFFQDTSTLFDVIKFIRNDNKIPLFAQVFLQKYKPTDILKNICDINNTININHSFCGGKGFDVYTWCFFAEKGINMYDILDQHDIFNLEKFGCAYKPDGSPCSISDSDLSLNNHYFNTLVVTYLPSGTSKAYNKYNYMKFVSMHRKDPITHQSISNEILEYVLGSNTLIVISY